MRSGYFCGSPTTQLKDLSMPIPTFQTERLLLRGVTLADVPSYTDHFVDYDVIRHLSRTAPWPYPENGVQEYLSNVILPDQGVRRWAWGIFLLTDPDSLVGCVELVKEGKPENRGFWLGKKFWNKGIMTEAVFPTIDCAFYDLGFEQLIFSNAAGNLASRKIKEKTGCELVDVRPAEFVDPTYTHQEIWTLSSKSWEKHKLSNRSKYTRL